MECLCVLLTSSRFKSKVALYFFLYLFDFLFYFTVACNDLIYVFPFFRSFLEVAPPFSLFLLCFVIIIIFKNTWCISSLSIYLSYSWITIQRYLIQILQWDSLLLLFLLCFSDGNAYCDTNSKRRNHRNLCGAEVHTHAW